MCKYAQRSLKIFKAAVKEYTTGELVKKLKESGGPSLSTLMRWEEDGVFPAPLRRKRNKARIWTDDHLEKIIAYRDATEPPEPKTPKKMTSQKRKGRR